MTKWGPKGTAQYRKANREYQRQWRAQDPEGQRAYIQAWCDRNRTKLRAQDLARREKAKAHIIACKSVPCRDCKKGFGPHVMDFDHIRGKKIANIGSGRFHGSMKALKKEIAKCDVVCANCHREREHKRFVRSPAKWMRGWKKS